MMNVAEKEGIARIVGDPAAESRVSTSPPSLLQARRLHNFSFPTLSWGGQRLLRCSKLPDPVATADIAESVDQNHRTARIKSFPPRQYPGDHAGREEEPRGREAEKTSTSAEATAEAARPWNLRIRSAACNAPAVERPGINVSCYKTLATKKADPPRKVARLRSDESEKGAMAKFSISLSRAEIEDDFFAIKGTKPPRRPKKRAKIIQRELDSLFPGKKAVGQFDEEKCVHFIYVKRQQSGSTKESLVYQGEARCSCVHYCGIEESKCCDSLTFMFFSLLMGPISGDDEGSILPDSQTANLFLFLTRKRKKPWTIDNLLQGPTKGFVSSRAGDGGRTLDPSLLLMWPFLAFHASTCDVLVIYDKVGQLLRHVYQILN
ncbi:hypothetical protein OPV22_000852 [Ensete ventricosum]|uniref:Uncharacterized protein n=1 Tax=Ensete ventricosum TaxID=4639 RepID=A0AAV8RVR9_ENSVE|nr:hypothetical protein OPV22_000852 [Ensete ventricosum]